MFMSTNDIRSAFLEFFARKGHRVVPSSSLIPENDPSLLFTAAGMVQFKDVFLGRETRAYRRATSAQRCLRAGGKQNDLENVGYTARHHTFFEMLGNFSFGDYFKEEAILYAWELLTDVFRLPQDRLWATVYVTDEAAYDVFKEKVGLPASRIVKIGDKPGGKDRESDNFWQMGDTGPCGPCAEIFYDHGPDVKGAPPGSESDEDGDRYIEIWNLVFMQYDRAVSGELKTLPAPCVDTGMGLERISAVLQGVHSNYEIDLFKRLMAAVSQVTEPSDPNSNSLKVIADHIRATAFLIADGVTPSNEGRGYVLRRIMRRAIRHGYKLGKKEKFLWRLVEPLASEMAEAYPILQRARVLIESTIRKEEAQFADTLHRGMGILEESLNKTEGNTLSGEVAFRLYDTYGFPLDLTQDAAKERGFSVDLTAFEEEMSRQRSRARAASRFHVDYSRKADLGFETEFVGYQSICESAKVVGLLVNDSQVSVLEQDDEGAVILDKSPFYPESGGQVGDTGQIVTESGVFSVEDTQKRDGAILHLGRVKQGQVVSMRLAKAQVCAGRRQAIAANHSATHLLHAALREILGSDVSQKGSLVAPDRLRFDFSYSAALSRQVLTEIELRVNEWIRADVQSEVQEIAYQEAVAQGAIALFGEKYGEHVRTLRFGDVSLELCGGTHVSRTGVLGLFKIIAEGAVSSGVRRIEALTGEAALNYVHRIDANLTKVCQMVNASRTDLVDKIDSLVMKNRALEKELDRLKEKIALGAAVSEDEKSTVIGGHRVVTARLADADARTLRALVDKYKSKYQSAVIAVGTAQQGKVQLAFGVTCDLVDRLSAADLAQALAVAVGGRGGGRRDFAQAGGTIPDNLDKALESVAVWVSQRVS